MHRHVHASYQCVVPETGDIHVVEKLQHAEQITEDIDETSGIPHIVFTGPPYYSCPGFNLVSHLKDAHGRIIGFRMYRQSSVMADPVEVTVATSVIYTEPEPQRPESGQSSVTIDHSGKHVPRKEEI